MRAEYLFDAGGRSLAPFFSRTMLSLAFNCVFILSLIFLLFWPYRELSAYVAGQQTPLSFLGVFTAAALINGYVGLLCGGNEAHPRDYFSRMDRKSVVTFEEERGFLTYGLVGFALHTLFLLGLQLPLLLAAAALTGVSWVDLIRALSILFITALLCRLAGFLSYLHLGAWTRFGYVTTRTFFLVFILATGLLLPAANPVLELYAIYEELPMTFAPPLGGYAGFLLVTLAAMLALILAVQTRIRRGPAGLRGGG
jgi:hypothetical protein